MRKSRGRIAAAIVVTFAGFSLGDCIGGIPHDAPSLSVHESCYGTSNKNGRSESIQGIDIGIVSRSESPATFTVECFFLKKGTLGAPPTIHDVVRFEVTDPHDTYRVSAHPLAVKGVSGQTKTKGSSKSRTAGSSSKTTIEAPREGFLVRVLRNGDHAVLREHASSHSVALLAKEDPELFAKASSDKKVRTLDAGNFRIR